ncbi:hypothetical protein ACHAWF_003531 [Thalassiosira exigua]
MSRSPPSTPAAPHVTTETFQKHYRRGSGYPVDHSYSHHGHPPPPPPHQNYSPSHHYAPPGQHAPPPPPPPPPPGHRGGPPPAHGHGYAHPSWSYYPPHGGPPIEAPPPGPGGASPAPSRRGASSRSGKAGVPPNLVTPKSHDSETLPPALPAAKKSPAKSPSKKASKAKNKESYKPTSPGNGKELPESEEELKVDPMKQDFHFYAVDHYEEAWRASREQIDKARAEGTADVPEDAGKDLFVLTTLLNARLVKIWEGASPATRSEYLKREEADRKRFMSEEEVASRHCATLTARRRSPKQSGAGGVGRAASFGLGATVEVPEKKRTGAELNAEASATKRVCV